MRFQENRHYVFFDSHCPMCSKWARKILQWDTEGVFILISAHSTIAASWAIERGLGIELFQQSILYFRPGALWYQEAKALKLIGKNLKGLPLILGILLWVAPEWLINLFYRLIASNRRKEIKECNITLKDSFEGRLIL
jgi:predicted DCC family thiol-disulfide oxidoreductase YuxK